MATTEERLEALEQTVVTLMAQNTQLSTDLAAFRSEFDVAATLLATVGPRTAESVVAHDALEVLVDDRTTSLASRADALEASQSQQDASLADHEARLTALENPEA